MKGAANYTPLVSIILPTYNRADLITDTIQSVLNQSYDNWELIVVDDGSTDATAEVIRSFNNPRIHYERIDHCGILGRVRNTGIRKAAGEYIAFLDSDDLWRNDKLARQLEFISDNDIMFAFSNGSHFGDGAKIQPPEFVDKFVGNLFLSLMVEHRFVVYMPSFIFKKEIFNSISLIDENMRSGGDVDFVYRMAFAFRGGFSNERLVSIRKHNRGMSSKLEETAHLESIQTIDRFFKQGALSKKHYVALMAVLFYKLGLYHMVNSQPSKSFVFFLKHNMLRPFYIKGWIRLGQATIKRLFNKTAAAPGASRK